VSYLFWQIITSLVLAFIISMAIYAITVIR
jgi:hypothetical protein